MTARRISANLLILVKHGDVRTLLATSGDTVADGIRRVANDFAWRKWLDTMTG
jgi:hypothetical protein